MGLLEEKPIRKIASGIIELYTGTILDTTRTTFREIASTMVDVVKSTTPEERIDEAIEIATDSIKAIPPKYIAKRREQIVRKTVRKLVERGE